MTEKSPRQPHAGKAKEQKRADALRQNLLRRKEQIRKTKEK